MNLQHVCWQSLRVRNNFRVKQFHLPENQKVYLFQTRENLLMVDGKTKESSSNKLVPRQDTSDCSECQPKADAVILKQKYISGNEQCS
jgi:hypothetical protein